MASLARLAAPLMRRRVALALPVRSMAGAADGGHKAAPPAVTASGELTPEIKQEIEANYAKYKDQLPKLSPEEQAKVDEWRKQILSSEDPAIKGGFGPSGIVPDTFLQSTGKERAELLEIAKGNLVSGREREGL